MSERSKSEMAFIQAAGELFAQRGIDGVSTKEIGKAAGIDASMIKYHFGSKDGLVNAVVEHAVEPWHTDNIETYYSENKNLLETRDGQIVFITGMVDTIFRIFNSGKEDSWCKNFILQLIQRPHRLRQEILDKHIKPGVSTFFEIHRKITGNEDFESAFCWYLFLICPMFLYSGSTDMISCFHPNGGVSNGFEQRLKIFTVRQILAGFQLN